MNDRPSLRSATGLGPGVIVDPAIGRPLEELAAQAALASTPTKLPIQGSTVKVPTWRTRRMLSKAYRNLRRQRIMELNSLVGTGIIFGASISYLYRSAVLPTGWTIAPEDNQWNNYYCWVLDEEGQQPVHIFQKPGDHRAWMKAVVSDEQEKAEERRRLKIALVRLTCELIMMGILIWYIRNGHSF